MAGLYIHPGYMFTRALRRWNEICRGALYTQETIAEDWATMVGRHQKGRWIGYTRWVHLAADVVVGCNLSTADEATGTANGSRKASITFLMKRMGSSDGWGEGGERERDFVRQNPRSCARSVGWKSGVRSCCRREEAKKKLILEETVGNGEKQEKKEKSNRGGMRATVFSL